MYFVVLHIGQVGFMYLQDLNYSFGLDCEKALVFNDLTAAVQSRCLLEQSFPFVKFSVLSI